MYDVGVDVPLSSSISYLIDHMYDKKTVRYGFVSDSGVTNITWDDMVSRGLVKYLTAYRLRYAIKPASSSPGTYYIPGDKITAPVAIYKTDMPIDTTFMLYSTSLHSTEGYYSIWPNCRQYVFIGPWEFTPQVFKTGTYPRVDILNPTQCSFNNSWISGSISTLNLACAPGAVNINVSKCTTVNYNFVPDYDY